MKFLSFMWQLDSLPSDFLDEPMDHEELGRFFDNFLMKRMKRRCSQIRLKK